MGLAERFARVSAAVGALGLLAALGSLFTAYAALAPFFALAGLGLLADAYLPPDDAYGVTDVGIVLKLSGAAVSLLLVGTTSVGPAATVLHSGGLGFAYQYARGPRFSVLREQLFADPDADV